MADHLRELPSPDEAAFVCQLFVRAFGTNNLPDCSNMCHESSGRRAHRHHRIGIGIGIGIGEGSVGLETCTEPT
ncbi:hypothetical protein AB0H36_39970 [Kribbella sp. NPDC050820]|uniref:hypothetical protein n=1 Tax=Kribbella sp. NPDC050820 TaxID=3155408 RepID=UPI0033D63FC5